MTQKEALDLLMMGKNVYLTGQAGSGKTYVLNRYIEFLKSQKIPVAVTASTGIAATHLNGNTIHSWSGIGIKSELLNNDLKKIAANKQKREKIRDARVLIIDEISMLHASRLDMVNQVCKYIRKNMRPFGGLQVVLCGDFFQLPPIPEKGSSRPEFAYKSAAWKELNLTVCYLNEQHRQDDDAFLRLLQEIRTQEVTEYTGEKLSNRLHATLSGRVKPTKLYTHNADVDAMNNAELEKIASTARRYTMVTRGPKLLVDSLVKGCLAPSELVLKKGASVIFIKNNPAKGYVNGTLGTVVGFNADTYPIVETFSGREIVATPASWLFEEGDSALAEIGQIPLRLAWAITVHKSQGMSLDAAEMDLSKAFTYGMGYVALSRVKSLSGIRLLGINPTALQVDSAVAEFDVQLIRESHDAVQELQSLTEDTVHDKKSAFMAFLKEDIQTEYAKTVKLFT